MYLIVANWKMNPPNLRKAKSLFEKIREEVKSIKNTKVVICSPFVYLRELKIKNKGSKIKLGAQDCFWERSGDFTGEISPVMLKNLGAEYVILGHSERRIFLRETDEMINKKIKAALSARVTPILCIGETKEERKKGKTNFVLKTQIKKTLNNLSTLKIKNLILAYEPIWAIGTGNPCGINEAREALLFLRGVLNKIFSPEFSKKIKIIYGGSVNSKNAKDYIKRANFAGLLVGGASLRPKEFLKIIEALGQ